MHCPNHIFIQYPDMEGGLLRVRRQRGIPAGPDVRPPHCGARRRVGGPHHLLPGQR